MLLLFGLYQQNVNKCYFCLNYISQLLTTLYTSIFNSTNRLSFILWIHKKFAGNSSPTCNIMAPAFWSLTSRKGALNLSISNLHIGKFPLISVSENINILTFPLNSSESKSNLFLMEFMLIWAILSLFGRNSKNYLQLLFSSESLEIIDLNLPFLLELSAELGFSNEIQNFWISISTIYKIYQIRSKCSVSLTIQVQLVHIKD